MSSEPFFRWWTKECEGEFDSSKFRECWNTCVAAMMESNSDFMERQPELMGLPTLRHAIQKNLEWMKV